jgi:hypothetical protein
MEEPMNITTLQTVLETAPARSKQLNDEIEARMQEKGAITFFLDMIRHLRTSWHDDDPGKYGPYLSCYKGGNKTWPRELVDTAAVAAHVEAYRKRFPLWKEYDVWLAPLAELDQHPCPRCQAPALLIRSYQQTHDSPGGDEWAKRHYLACTQCVALYQFGESQISSERF